MKKKLAIYTIIFIILSTGTFLNIHILYNDKEKAIYNYINSKVGTFIANSIRLKYQSTDNIVNPVIKSYGEWYDVYGAKGFTGKYKVLYIAVKADEKNVYKVTTVKTDP
ncbi:hypothetical protein [Clostridium sp.]|uniref:hypothetical protein n=1 Tax=Clostridium sp. TaxID=1506 RepID=UPI003D6DA5E0